MSDISANNYSLSVQTPTNGNLQLEITEVQRGIGQGKSRRQMRGEISLLQDWVPSHKNTRYADLRLKIRTKLENWSRCQLLSEDRGCKCSTATGNITLDTTGNVPRGQDQGNTDLKDNMEAPVRHHSG